MAIWKVYELDTPLKVIPWDRQGNGRTMGRINMIMLLVGLTIGAVIGFAVVALLRGGE